MPDGADESVKENAGVVCSVTGAATVSAIAARTVRSLPPIDCTLRALIELDDGVTAPEGKPFESESDMLAAALPGGTVIDDALMPDIAAKVTVVEAVVDVVVCSLLCVDPPPPPPPPLLLLLPPPPHPVIAAPSVMTKRTDDMRSKREFKRAP